MYIEEMPYKLNTTTIVYIRYDCCNKNHKLKWRDANKNFQKNNQKHICRNCWLKNDNPSKNKINKE